MGGLDVAIGTGIVVWFLLMIGAGLTKQSVGEMLKSIIDFAKGFKKREPPAQQYLDELEGQKWSVE
jgi:hypothetical protein